MPAESGGSSGYRRGGKQGFRPDKASTTGPGDKRIAADDIGSRKKLRIRIMVNRRRPSK